MTDKEFRKRIGLRSAPRGYIKLLKRKLKTPEKARRHLRMICRPILIGPTTAFGRVKDIFEI